MQSVEIWTVSGLVKLSTPRQRQQAKKTYVDEVEYHQSETDTSIWRAVDGSQKVIAGPEVITGNDGAKGNYYYVSALGDYFKGDFYIQQWANHGSTPIVGLVIHTDEPGVMEDMLLNGEKPVEKLKKMTFKMKDLVEEEKGKKLTVHDQIKWFKHHPTVRMQPTQITTEDRVVEISTIRQMRHAKKTFVDELEYHQSGTNNSIWRAVDGSQKVIAGPEVITGNDGAKVNYFYVSALGDYYRGNYLVQEIVDYGETPLVGLVIRTDEPGVIESILLNGEKPVEKLNKMTFKMKDLVEKEKGQNLTILDQIKWFRFHPTVRSAPSFEKRRRERMTKIHNAYPKEADL